MRGILFTGLVLFQTVLSVAQTQVTIDEVKVSATRSSEEFSKVARSVIVISKEEIEASAATSINEVLEFASGVDVRQRGQQGVQADLSIRGSSFEQVLILLNGVKMTDPQTGHHALNLPISLLDIERIEILHGGAARIYGPGAFAGAINIITQTPEISQAKIQLLAGQNGLQQLGISASVVEKNHAHNLSYQTQNSDGFVRNTDYNSENIFWQSSLQLKKGGLKLNLGQNAKEFGAQNFYTVNFPEQFEATKTQFASLSGAINLENLTISPRAYFRRHNDRFELLREGGGYYERLVGGGFANDFGDTISWYNGHNYHQTDVSGGELTASYQSKLGKTNVGYEYRREEIWSNNLGENLEKEIKVKNELSTAFYTKGALRENTSLFLEHNYSTEKLFVSAGALLNYNSDFDEEIYPGIDIAYQVDDELRAYASVNKSFRFPSYTDLYYRLGGAIGSINLKPEKSVNYELGLKYNDENGYGHISLFKREGDNLIDWVRLSGSFVTQATNLTDVVINGFELDYVTKTEGWVKDISWLNQFRLNYTFMQSENNSEGFESNYVLDFLEIKTDAVLQLKLTKTILLDWRSSYQDRKGEFVNVKGEEKEYEGIFLTDVKLSTQQKQLNVFVQVSNLFDVDYFDLGNVQNPGRWFSAGLRYNIEFKK